MFDVRERFGKQFNCFSKVPGLIIKSWSEGTAKQYAPHLKMWFSFHSENGLDPFNAEVTILLSS